MALYKYAVSMALAHAASLSARYFCSPVHTQKETRNLLKAHGTCIEMDMHI